MRRTLVPLVIALALLPVRAGAAPTLDVVIAGSGNYGDGKCLMFAGYSNTTAARERWEGVYMPAEATPNAAGICVETDDHVDIKPVCMELVVGAVPATPAQPTALYAQVRGHDNKIYLMIIIDRGSDQGADLAGVLLDKPEGERCGTKNVKPAPIYAGNFTILPT